MADHGSKEINKLECSVTIGKIPHLSKVLETRGCYILSLLSEFGVFKFYGTQKHTELQ